MAWNYGEKKGQSRIDAARARARLLGRVPARGSDARIRNPGGGLQDAESQNEAGSLRKSREGKARPDRQGRKASRPQRGRCGHRRRHAFAPRAGAPRQDRSPTRCRPFAARRGSVPASPASGISSRSGSTTPITPPKPAPRPEGADSVQQGAVLHRRTQRRRRYPQGLDQARLGGRARARDRHARKLCQRGRRARTMSPAIASATTCPSAPFRSSAPANG